VVSGRVCAQSGLLLCVCYCEHRLTLCHHRTPTPLGGLDAGDIRRKPTENKSGEKTSTLLKFGEGGNKPIVALCCIFIACDGPRLQMDIHKHPKRP